MGIKVFGAVKENYYKVFLDTKRKCQISVNN